MNAEKRYTASDVRAAFVKGFVAINDCDCPCETNDGCPICRAYALAVARGHYPATATERPVRVAMSDGTVWSFRAQVDHRDFVQHYIGYDIVYSFDEMRSSLRNTEDALRLARMLSGETEEVEDV